VRKCSARSSDRHGERAQSGATCQGGSTRVRDNVRGNCAARQSRWNVVSETYCSSEAAAEIVEVKELAEAPDGEVAAIMKSVNVNAAVVEWDSVPLVPVMVSV